MIYDNTVTTPPCSLNQSRRPANKGSPQVRPTGTPNGRIAAPRHPALPDLLRFGAIDARFPDYSTIDQFLTEPEHLQLVALGHHLAERMVALHDGGNSIQDRV